MTLEVDEEIRTEKQRALAAAAEAQRKKNLRRIGCIALLSVVGFCTFTIGLRACVFEAFEIEGPSMEPALASGDRIIVAKYAYGVFLPFADEALMSWDGPEPGEIVILRSPADDIDVSKRVIAVAGQRIELVGDEVRVDGESLSTGTELLVTVDGVAGGARCHEERVGEATWFTIRNLDSPPGDLPPTLVPEGHVFVLGDHRDRSADSRYFGAVPVERVKGSYLAHYRSSEPRQECR